MSFGSKVVKTISSKDPKKGRKLVLKKKEKKKEKKETCIRNDKNNIKEVKNGKGLSHLLSLDDWYVCFNLLLFFPKVGIYIAKGIMK